MHRLLGWVLPPACAWTAEVQTFPFDLPLYLNTMGTISRWHATRSEACALPLCMSMLCLLWSIHGWIGATRNLSQPCDHLNHPPQHEEKKRPPQNKHSPSAAQEEDKINKKNSTARQQTAAHERLQKEGGTKDPILRLPAAGSRHSYPMQKFNDIFVA